MDRELSDFSTNKPGLVMQHDSLDAFLKTASATLAKGPVAMIFVEDEVEIGSTVRHHLDCGFKAVVVLMPDALNLPADVSGRVERVPFDVTAGGNHVDTVNRVMAAAPGIWMYYCFNAEYLFFPFCESRTVGDLLTFHTEEQRGAMLCYVVDLYAGDLQAHPNAVSLEDAHLDKSGYYTLARNDPDNRDHPKERQLDFFGGLRWRYEEHIPTKRRKIDRIALFQAKPGLTLRDDHTFSDEEYNTYACPWHHNLTAAIVSFRTAKALKSNPGSTFDIQTFKWHNSTPFAWHSRQLLDFGLMEPGQWF
jgi:hypothetical protein